MAVQRLSKDPEFQAVAAKVKAARTYYDKLVAAGAPQLSKFYTPPLSDKARRIASVLTLTILDDAYATLPDADAQPGLAADLLQGMQSGDYAGVLFVRARDRLKKLSEDAATLATQIATGTASGFVKAQEAQRQETAEALKNAPKVPRQSKNPAFIAAKGKVDSATNLSDKLRAARAGDLYLYGPLSDQDRRLYGTLTQLVLEDAFAQLPPTVAKPGMAYAIMQGLQGVRDRPLATLADVGNPELPPAIDALRALDSQAANLLSGWIRGAGEQLEQRQLQRAVERATDFVTDPITAAWRALPTSVKVALGVAGAVYLYRLWKK